MVFLLFKQKKGNRTGKRKCASGGIQARARLRINDFLGRYLIKFKLMKYTVSLFSVWTEESVSYSMYRVCIYAFTQCQQRPTTCVCRRLAVPQKNTQSIAVRRVHACVRAAPRLLPASSAPPPQLPALFLPGAAPAPEHHCLHSTMHRCLPQ